MNKSQLRKRIESFGWRIGGMIVIAGLSFIIEPETIKALEQSGMVLPVVLIGIIGLIVGEITKFLNKKIQLSDQD